MPGPVMELLAVARMPLVAKKDPPVRVITPPPVSFMVFACRDPLIVAGAESATFLLESQVAESESVQ